MKKLFTLVALLAMFLGANAQGGKWEQVYTIDYSTYNAFPFYVMAYAPTFDGTGLVDAPTTKKLWRGNENDFPGEDACEGTVTVNGNEFYVQETGENQWRQYFVADGIQTKIDGKYKVVAKVKASEAVTINVNMGWGWGQGESKGASVAIPGSTDFQVVEWTYEGIGGSSCNLVAQPATSTATIEWQSLVVYEWQKENQRPKVWQEWLTSDGNPVTLPDKSTAIPFPPATVANWMGNASKDWPTDATADGSYWKGDNVGLICAWGKTKGRNLGPNFAGTGEGFNPFPADIEEVDGNRVFVVHGAKADTEGDAAAWDNQFWIQSPREWKSGEKVKIHFRYKASKTVEVETQTHKKNPSEYLIWHGIGNITFTEEWKEYDGTTTIADDMAGGWSFAFNLNAKDKEAIDFYFDDISWQSMVLDQGYFVSGINATTTTSYDDLDNAIEFEKEGDYFVATVGTPGSANSYVDQIMISTVRGDDEAFKTATLKPDGKIQNDAETWLEYSAATNTKLNLPGLGVWKIYIDTDYKAMAFKMLEGTPYEQPDPVAIVTNEEEIVINAVEREPTSQEQPADEEAGIPAGTGATWDNQFFIFANRKLNPGEVTVLEFDYSATTEARSTAAWQNDNGYVTGAFNLENDNIFNSTEKHFKQTLTVPAKTWQGNEIDGITFISFDLACIKDANDYTFKNIKWYLADEELNANNQTTENLISATGTSNFKKKIGAGTGIIPLGIINVINNATIGSDVIYNLSGQRVSKDYKGIVIMNGRKVVNK